MNKDIKRIGQRLVGSLDYRLQNAKDVKGAVISWLDSVLLATSLPDEERDALLTAMVDAAEYHWESDAMGTVTLVRDGPANEPEVQGSPEINYSDVIPGFGKFSFQARASKIGLPAETDRWPKFIRASGLRSGKPLKFVRLASPAEMFWSASMNGRLGAVYSQGADGASVLIINE
jgi:hypothetical protein